MGKKIQISYEGDTHTLLSFWEDIIPKRLRQRYPSIDASLQHYSQRSPQWSLKTPPELFRDWARESAEVVCHQVYAALEVKLEDGTQGIDENNPFVLNEELLQRWLQLAEDLSNLAGQRTAFILRDILEHGTHRAAAREGRGRHRSRHRIRHGWAWSLAANAVIAMVLVPFILTCFRWHARGSISFFTIATGHAKS